MTTYLIANDNGELTQQVLSTSDKEPSMGALIEKFSLPHAKMSFVRLAHGQSLVLRTEHQVLEAA